MTSIFLFKAKEELPFNDAVNPIMSMVAFLASVVNPEIAAAAAQAVLGIPKIDSSRFNFKIQF
jgi:hypothetical protein